MFTMIRWLFLSVCVFFLVAVVTGGFFYATENPTGLLITLGAIALVVVLIWRSPESYWEKLDKEINRNQWPVGLFPDEAVHYNQPETHHRSADGKVFGWLDGDTVIVNFRDPATGLMQEKVIPIWMDTPDEVYDHEREGL